MRVTTKRELAHKSRVLQFSAQEWAALQRASRIAAEAREVLRAELGEAAAEDHPADLLLAELEHNCKDFEKGAIVISEDFEFSF